MPVFEDLFVALATRWLTPLIASATDRRQRVAVEHALAVALRESEQRHPRGSALIDPKLLADVGGEELARTLLPGPAPDPTRLVDRYKAGSGTTDASVDEVAAYLGTLLETFSAEAARTPVLRELVDEVSSTRSWTSDPLSGLDLKPTSRFARSPAFLRFENESVFADRVAALVGPRAIVSRSALGPDIWVESSDTQLPLAIEVRIWQWSAKNARNRSSEVLSRAVRLRREYPHGVRLAFLAVLISSQDAPGAALASWRDADALRDLLRRTQDDAGFDQVFIRLWDDPARWVEIRGGNDEPEFVEPFSEVVSRLRQPPIRALPSPAPTKDREDAPDPASPPSILLIGSEWSSGRGGISTINRELAIGFAAAGCVATLMVPDATQDERDDATASGVTLVTPDPIPGLEGHELLLTRPRFPDPDFYPDVIVGHGRILGPYAYAAKNLWFPKAQRLHIVHVDAERLEAVKDPRPHRSPVLTADERRKHEAELAISADLVAGVGPLLSELIRDEMRGFRRDPPQVIELVPGLRDWGSSVDPADPPGRRQVLLIARADDIRAKGIDIAARAVADAVGRFDEAAGDRPTLVVRGVPGIDPDGVKAQLDAFVAPQTEVVARPFSTDLDSLRRDLWQSRVVVMPSREEGFGLVALEAIAAGVPVRISRDSGLGRMLRQRVVDGERPLPRELLPVRGDDDETMKVWSDEIHSCLLDPVPQFARASELREELLQSLSWSRTVADVLEALAIRPARDDTS